MVSVRSCDGPPQERNSRKTERGAPEFLTCLEVRAAHFALEGTKPEGLRPKGKSITRVN